MWEKTAMFVYIMYGAERSGVNTGTIFSLKSWMVCNLLIIYIVLGDLSNYQKSSYIYINHVWNSVVYEMSGLNVVFCSSLNIFSLKAILSYVRETKIEAIFGWNLLPGEMPRLNVNVL